MRLRKFAKRLPTKTYGSDLGRKPRVDTLDFVLERAGSLKYCLAAVAADVKACKQSIYLHRCRKRKRAEGMRILPNSLVTTRQNGRMRR